jgi:hypothetical protein
MGPLRTIRIGRSALALVALVSSLATVVIIHSGLRRTPAQTAALVALAQHRQLAAGPRATPATTTVVAPPSSSSTAGGGDGTDDNGGSGSPGSSSADGSGNDSGGSSGDSSGDSGDDGSNGSDVDTSTTTSATPSPDAGLPSVGHVFLIALSTPGYADAFGKRSDAPYLRSLVRKGTLLTHFDSLGHGELADELAMVSGQAPNPDTSAGCTTFREYPSSAAANSRGLVPGKGCVYPDTALTLGDQVTSDGKAWGAYIDAMGKTTCQHPNSNASTRLGLPGTGPGYDVLHNPFVFFHSLLDAGDCFNDDHDLSKLTPALKSASRTPRLSFVAPDACADGNLVATKPSGIGTTTTGTSSSSSSTTTGATTTGTGTTSTPTTTSTTTTASGTTTTTTTTTNTTASSTPTTTTTTTTASSTPTTTTSTSTGTSPASTPAGCPAGASSGLPAEDAFLKQWVPAITRSAAYRRNGVLVIAFAGTRSPGHPVSTGALVLSRYTHANQTVTSANTPYSLLRSIEDMLNDKALAHAAKAPSFAKAVLGASS